VSACEVRVLLDRRFTGKPRNCRKRSIASAMLPWPSNPSPRDTKIRSLH
jgi:hypothetical protein